MMTTSVNLKPTPSKRSNNMMSPSSSSSSFGNKGSAAMMMINNMYNPLVEDEELQSLLQAVGSIRAVGIFARWRVTFLTKLESLLEPEGIELGSQANAALLRSLTRFNKVIDVVHKACCFVVKNNGGSALNNNNSKNKKLGVKAQNAINRLKEGCVQTEQQLKQFVPASTADIVAVGYNKFHLAAVLVRDGFEVYGHIMWQQATLDQLKGILQQVVLVDHEVIKAITYYRRQIQSLCGVMADLGLLTVMVKMRELARDDTTSLVNRCTMEFKLNQNHDAATIGEDDDDDDNDDDDEEKKEDDYGGSLPHNEFAGDDTTSFVSQTMKLKNRKHNAAANGLEDDEEEKKEEEDDWSKTTPSKTPSTKPAEAVDNKDATSEDKRDGRDSANDYDDDQSEASNNTRDEASPDDDGNGDAQRCYQQ